MSHYIKAASKNKLKLNIVDKTLLQMGIVRLEDFNVS